MSLTVEQSEFLAFLRVYSEDEWIGLASPFVRRQGIIFRDRRESSSPDQIVKRRSSSNMVEHNVDFDEILN